MHSTLPRRVCVPLGLLGLTLLYFWPQVAGGRALYWGDIGLYFLPMQAFLKTNFDAGRVPLWNPLLLCGTPYVGNPQTWPLYPASALLAFFSPTQAINLTVALHVWLAGLGTYAFARRALALGRGPAALSAITFMFGGQLVSKEQFPNMVQAAAWLPWILWALDGLLRRGRVRDALALGLTVGLQLLAAHAQMTFLSLYLALAYGVFVLREKKGGRRGLGRLAARLGLAGVVAGGLAMGQILPTVALFRDAARQHLSFGTVNRFYLPPNQLGNFVLPHAHGSPFSGDWAARGNFWETCCYVGLIPFVLAVWGTAAAWRTPNAARGRFWAGVLGVSVLLAMGGNGLLYWAAYWVLPGVRNFHDPARCLLPACFALSLLAGLGLASLRLTRARVTSPRLALPALACLLAFADLAHFGRTLYPLAAPRALSPVTPDVALVRADPDVRAGRARLLAPTEGVWPRFTNYKDYGRSVPDYQARWADTLSPNLTMLYGLPDAFGYEPVALRNAQETAGGAARAFESAAPDDARRAARDAGALAVKYVALCRVSPPASDLPGLAPVRSAGALAPPGHSGGPRASIFLSRDALWQPRARLDGLDAPVTITDAGPDRVSLAWAAPRAARLVLADTDAAGWRATLDGRPAPIRAYGGCLRALDVSGPGPHRAEFVYRPEAWHLGLYVSLLTLAGLCAAGAFLGASLGARKFSGRGGVGARPGE